MTAFSLDLLRAALEAPAKLAKIPVVYPGAIARFIAQALNNAKDAMADQHQSNGAYAVHQLRVRLPGDATVYRVVVAPADAPIFIGQCPADDHFMEPLQ